MIDILTTSDDTALAKAMEANLAAFWLGYGQTPTGESHTTPYLMSFSSLLPHPLFNAAFGGEFSDMEECDQSVRDVTAYFQSKPRPAMWWVGPSAQSPVLTDSLKRSDWHHIGDAPVMLLDLHRLKAVEPINGLTIERVQDDRSLRAWADILGSANDIPTYMLDMLYNLESTRGFRDDCYVRYLATFNGQPAAASAVYYHAGLAGIFAVATDAKLRRNGFGRAVTAAPLIEAKQRGYRYSVLQASELGYAIYQRLGFEQRWLINLFAHQ